MKRIYVCLLVLGFSLGAAAQGNNGKIKSNKASSSSKGHPSDPVLVPGNSDKSKDKDKDKNKSESNLKMEKAKNDEHDRKVWDGIGNSDCTKPSKNQPAKVRSAFQRDYPGAINVRWTKCRGDWTATFNGLMFRSTAVYHANGDRRDTRTPVIRESIPRKIIDIILKKDPRTPIDGAIKIEVPNVIKDIFRIRNLVNGQVRFDYYDADGAAVTYNY